MGGWCCGATEMKILMVMDYGSIDGMDGGASLLLLILEKIYDGSTCLVELFIISWRIIQYLLNFLII